MFRRTDFRKIELVGGGKKNTKWFKVEQIKTKKLYVLKEIEAKTLNKLNEYKEEAAQLSRVQKHPNILQIYGYYFYETTHSTFKLGIICEYINQETNLEIIFRKREKQRLNFKENQLLLLMYSMIDAFAYWEHWGICHRDIKPTNLFWWDNFEIKIIDFGESKESWDDEEEHSTMATIRGTPQYLSPILWHSHVIKQDKQVQHNMFKSDVFSAGWVLFQMAAMKDVNGFNQKTENVDGERLITNGLRNLGKVYSGKIIDIIKWMLIFDENKRPNFVDLARKIVGNEYLPRTDLSLMGQLQEQENRKAKDNFNCVSSSTQISSSNNITQPSPSTLSIKTDAETKALFSQYMEKNNLSFNMNTTTYWFEYAGNMIAKFQISKTENTKWKSIGKYKSTFPYHAITTFLSEQLGYFIIGGTDSNNTFQYINGQINQKASMNLDRSFMSVVYIKDKGQILAIGGYEYSEKNQLNSIECYDIAKDYWDMSQYENLKVARSQSNSILLNNKSIYVFGGYNKTLGTLNTIERINWENKSCEWLDLKLMIPLRRFAALKINESRILLMGGITRLCKDSDSTYIVDLNKKNISQFNPLPRGGIIEHDVIVDPFGQVHLFFENNYGTNPPFHVVFSYLDFNK